MTKVFLIYLIAINVITFIVYGIDKWKTKNDMWRIPESTLLVMAALGGSIGAWMAIQTFRHKTQHWKFNIGVPVILLLQIAFVFWMLSK